MYIIDYFNSGIVVFQVDCDEHKNVYTIYDVSGYPTLKWFPGCLGNS